MVRPGSDIIFSTLTCTVSNNLCFCNTYTTSSKIPESVSSNSTTSSRLIISPSNHKHICISKHGILLTLPSCFLLPENKKLFYCHQFNPFFLSKITAVFFADRIVPVFMNTQICYLGSIPILINIS